MSRNAENGLLIFVCNIYEIFVMQKCYVIFILQLELLIPQRQIDNRLNYYL